MKLLEDVVVIGGGPAGLSAALNSALEGFSTLLVERGPWGGRAAQSARIDNLLAFSGVQGPTLARLGKQHCEEHGVTTLQDEVLRIDGTQLTLASGERLMAKAIIVATGIQWRELEVEGLSEAIASGKARYGCMTEDASRLKGKRVAVLGGANSAGINALHFAHCGAREVLMLVRRNLDGMSAYLQRLVLEDPRINVELRSELEDVTPFNNFGGGLLLSLSNRPNPIGVDELFLFPDALPTTSFAPCEKDKRGFLIAPELCTSTPSLFACGDIRSGSVKRIATAMGEGAAVVFKVKQFLEEEKRCRTCVA